MKTKRFKFILLIFYLFFWSCNTNNAKGVIPDTTISKPIQVTEKPLAFPGAEGFGRDATGGRGGKVIFVTNLNDSGTGSLRNACLETGPRYILFKVSGNISLKSKLSITSGDLTIAGQSAPGDGICIKDYPVIIASDNVIIRFMRFRLGDQGKQEADALECRGHKNIIIDHCSVSWSTDETLSFYGNQNTSVQWCIISESLKNSVHFKGSHGYGGIWGGKNASFHHNLLAHHDSRNPRLGEIAGDIFALSDLVDVRNNVIYNWVGNSCYGGEGMNVNIVNNYYKPGPGTTKKERIIAIDKNITEGTAIYNLWGKYFITGNVLEGSLRATNDNWTYGVSNQFNSKYGVVSQTEILTIKQEQEHSISGNVFTHVASDAFYKVMEISGASFVRDAVDSRIVENVKNGSFSFKGSNGGASGIIDSQEDVGGYPPLVSLEPQKDSSKDGISDAWKQKKNLNIGKFEANGHDLSTAYDNLEVFLNELVSEVVVKQK